MPISRRSTLGSSGLLGRHRPDLPKEFYKSDRSRRHYVVVAGRRTDYTGKTYALRRELAKENGILLLHYDNLPRLVG